MRDSRVIDTFQILKVFKAAKISDKNLGRDTYGVK